MSKNNNGFNKYLHITFLIGFGFFTVGLMEPLYDSYVTIFLKKYIEQTWLIGLIMALDNVLALFLIPIISDISDKTNTKIGRRMPWIIILVPISAIFYSLLPYAAKTSLTALIVVIGLLNLSKQSSRGPIVALMPDMVPAEYRSQGNGVINTMGNIAGIAGTILLARLMDLDIVLPILGPTKDTLPFPLVGILAIFATILLFFFVKERKSPLYQEQVIKNSSTVKFKEKIKTVLTGSITRDGKQDQSTLFILVSLFFWFMAYQGLVPYMGVYSIETFDISTGSGAIASGMVAIAGVIFAIPMGFLASKFGRKKMIRISLFALVLVFLSQIAVFFLAESSTNPSQYVYLFWGIFFVFGIFWICIVANSFPILWQMASFAKIGLYTGLYYTFSQAAGILSPFFAGIVIDMVGYEGLFAYGATFFILAFITMGLVQGGEKFDKEESQQ